MKLWSKRLAKQLLLLLLCVGLLSLTVYAREDDGFYYGRNGLADLENAEALLYAYDAIVEGVEETADVIDVYDGTHPLSDMELEIVMDAYIRDYTHHFWLDSRYMYTYTPETVWSVILTYSLSGETMVNETYPAEEPIVEELTGEELRDAKRAFEESIDEILSGLRRGMNDFQKELYLHDALAKRVTYIESENAHNAYGALVDGEAVCEGYAEALQVLLHRAGIRSHIMIGDSLDPNSGELVPHAWNLVNINGEHYHVDLTWNDQDEIIFHAYFNVDDETIREDHLVDAPTYELPECDSDDANYFEVKGGKMRSFNAVTIGRLLKRHGGITHIYMSGDFDVNKLNEALDDPYQMATVMRIAGVRGAFTLQEIILGREVVLMIVEENEVISAGIEEVVENTVTVTVRGESVTADLYFAVYDEEGRMIGIEKIDSQKLSHYDGTEYTVSFEGTADLVRVFGLDDGVPYEAAEELAVEVEE